MTIPNAERPWLRGFGVAVAWTLVLSAPGGVLALVENHAPDTDRFVPIVASLASALPLLPFLALVLTARWVWQARDRVLILPGAQPVAYVAGLLVFQLVLAAGLGFGVGFARRRWLLGPAKPYARLASPDGARTAYASLECFFTCALEISVQEGSSPWMHEAHRYPNVRADAFPVLIWSADSQQVSAVGVQAGPPSVDWGPH